MSASIVSAAACTDTDTGSYFELAARAGAACLERARVPVDRIGLVVNAGVFRDSNISEPAVAALIQKRLGVGLEYQTGRLPAFSFDLMNGGTGLVHALTTVQCFLSPGADGAPRDVEYALILAGDTHPSVDRDAADFPYTAGAAALLLRADLDTEGFGRLCSAQTEGPAEPTAWVDLAAAGTNGRSALSLRIGAADPLLLAVAATKECLDAERLDRNDFATGAAVLLAPAPTPGFREQLAYRLGVPSVAVVGVDLELGDPYTAAPVHAYLSAARAGVLDDARAVLFLAADDSSAACVAYRPQSRTPAVAGARRARNASDV